MNLIEISLFISVFLIVISIIFLYIKYKKIPCIKEIKNIHKKTKKIAQLSQKLIKEKKLRITKLDKSFYERQEFKFYQLFSSLKINELKSKNIGQSTINKLEIFGYSRISDIPLNNLTSLPSIGPQKAMLISHRIDYLKRKINDELLYNEKYIIENQYDLDLIYNAINFININDNWKKTAQDIYKKNELFRNELNSMMKFNFIKFIFSKPTQFTAANTSYIKTLIYIHKWNVLNKQLDEQILDLTSRSISNNSDIIKKIFASRKMEIIDTLNNRFNTQLQHGSIAEKVAKQIEQTNFNPKLKEGVQLRPYQVFGAKFAIQAKKILLGDEMGLGKTLQALSVATHIQSQKNKVLALCIMPASLSENWKREIEKFTHLPIYILKGRNISQTLEKFIKYGGIAIISYEATWQRLVKTFNFNIGLDLLIIDEAHYIKNKSTNRAAACKKFISISEHVILMTGTPLENKTQEMINIIKHINEKIFKDIPTNEIETITPSDFSQLISPVYLRRKTNDVLKELPPKTITEEWIELSKNDKNAYIASIMDKSYHDMRRAVTLGNYSLSSPSAKIKRAKELVDEYISLDRKIIIFTYYLDVIDYLKNIFNTPFVLSGKIPINKRQQILDAFSSSNDEHILIAQITSTGIGLNIQAASVVLIIEPPLKPSTEEQAIARSHRIGQTSHVNVHKFFSKETIEERIHDILSEKSKQIQLYSDESRLKDVSKQATQVEEDETSFAKQIIEEEYNKYFQNSSTQ